MKRSSMRRKYASALLFKIEIGSFLVTDLKRFEIQREEWKKKYLFSSRRNGDRLMKQQSKQTKTYYDVQNVSSIRPSDNLVK